jgi:branched-chain amino acid transport system substrate-binding protein
VAEIEKTNRVGVMGRVRYDQGHQAIFGSDPQQTAVGVVFQWTEDGQRKIVFPQSVAEAKIQLPPGLKSLK